MLTPLRLLHADVRRSRDCPRRPIAFRALAYRWIVQSAGYAYRLKAAILKKEFERGGPLQQLLLRYTQSLITRMAQTAVCNRHHSLEQQLCRWLLPSLDRLPSNKLAATRELIANMLGVRHEGVTEAAGHLQTAGIMRYSRGHITILLPAPVSVYSPATAPNLLVQRLPDRCRSSSVAMR